MIAKQKVNSSIWKKNLVCDYFVCIFGWANPKTSWKVGTRITLRRSDVMHREGKYLPTEESTPGWWLYIRSTNFRGGSDQSCSQLNKQFHLPIYRDTLTHAYFNLNSIVTYNHRQLWIVVVAFKCILIRLQLSWLYSCVMFPQYFSLRCVAYVSVIFEDLSISMISLSVQIYALNFSSISSSLH